MNKKSSVSSTEQRQASIDHLPSRQQLMNAVEFVKREYQQLAQQLADKNARLEQLSRSTGKSSQQQFDLQMQNYELKSQLNQEKMTHIEHINEITTRFNRELDQQQLTIQNKYKQDIEKAEKRIKELEIQLISQTTSDSDGQMIAAMKQKMSQTQELLKKLNMDYTNTIEQRNQQILLLTNQLEKMKAHTSGFSRNQIQHSSQGEDVKQHHLQHIAQLESKVSQLAQTLLEYQNKQQINRIDDSGELYRALEQSQRLNDQLNVQLKEYHNRIEQMHIKHDQANKYNSLLSDQQLRIKDDILKTKKQQLDRCMNDNEELKLKLKQYQAEKQQDLDQVLQVSVEKFESKISAIRRSQSYKSEIPSIEPIQLFSRVVELENEVKQLKNQIANHNVQIENEIKEKDELIQRNKQLQAEISSIIEQLKTQSQTVIPAESPELQRLRLQNNEYKDKFVLLQKQAKRALDEHRETIERLEIGLAQINDWNKQLKQQESVFKREYQTLLKDNQQLTMRLENHEKTTVKLASSDELIGIQKQMDKLKLEKDTLQGKLKQAKENAELNDERLELLKVSKRDLEKKLQQHEAIAKQIDKKSTSYEGKIKKLNQSNNTYKEQLLHQKEEYRKLEQHCESIKQRHQQEIIGLQKSFDEMNQKLIEQKKSYEDKKTSLFSQKTSEFQKINQHTLKLQNETKSLREETARCQSESELLKKQKKELFLQIVRIRQEKQLAEQAVGNKDSLLRLKDKCFEQLNQQMQQLKMQQKEVKQYSDHSVIIADKDGVYEYIVELEEKCRLLQGFNAQMMKGSPQQGPLLNPKSNTNTLISENAELKNKINRLQREIGDARLETNKISLQLEQYKRYAMQELLLHKREEANIIKALDSEIDRLNSLIEAKEGANYLISQSLRIPNRTHILSARPVSNLAVSSLQSPLSFNTLPEGNLQKQRTLIESPNNLDYYTARNIRQRPWAKQFADYDYSDINSALNRSNFTAAFGRQS